MIKIIKRNFSTKLYNRITGVDWLGTVDFLWEKGYNVLNYAIVSLIEKPQQYIDNPRKANDINAVNKRHYFISFRRCCT